MSEDTQVSDHFVNQILKCPVSGVPLDLLTLEDGSIVWASEDGKESYPIKRGIARFVKDSLPSPLGFGGIRGSSFSPRVKICR